jgi:hypothetical protein
MPQISEHTYHGYHNIFVSSLSQKCVRQKPNTLCSNPVASNLHTVDRHQYFHHTNKRKVFMRVWVGLDPILLAQTNCLLNHMSRTTDTFSNLGRWHLNTFSLIALIVYAFFHQSFLLHILKYVWDKPATWVPSENNDICTQSHCTCLEAIPICKGKSADWAVSSFVTWVPG